MDTADLAGDAFFDLRSLVEPLECANNPRSSDCTNPEVNATGCPDSKPTGLLLRRNQSEETKILSVTGS